MCQIGNSQELSQKREGVVDRNSGSRQSKGIARKELDSSKTTHNMKYGT
jgi:hypothetical protein